MTRARAAIGWFLAIALLVVACGDDASPFVTTTAPTTTTAETTTTTAATTSTAATTTAPTTSAATTTAATTTSTATTVTTTTTTTTTAPAGCPGPGAGPIPGDATDVSSGAIALDGDGLTDVFSSYYQAGAWQLHADLGTGFTARLVLDDAWAAAHWPPGVNNVAPVRAHGLGSDEQVMLVRIYGGTVAAYAFFAFEDCQIVPLTGDDGRLPDLWVGMGPAHSDWPVCGPGPSVFQVVFGSPAGCGDIESCATPDLTVTEYRVQRYPARLLFVGESSWSSTQTEMDDFRSRTCLAP